MDIRVSQRTLSGVDSACGSVYMWDFIFYLTLYTTHVSTLESPRSLCERLENSLPINLLTLHACPLEI